jgi:predicted adenine nucleotide alpha hydrolase (AANH) superfamily ATPase
MKLWNAVVPRMRKKYNIPMDMSIQEALDKITLEEDKAVFTEAVKYPNGNWRKRNGYLRVVETD